ncbi:hypothetical protein [Streptomyces zagrosensis]|uniref:Uncharacterized protein n=1 Tax=Streptomyces zagrosensis TaxID=1042984 RepID=A0A7W9QDB1_9ACTN|nr:hypothetical protein [Streptomyces zagrosensis]MBB5937984.1 hypothetical protein [Streptomyces zagrosensis]
MTFNQEWEQLKKDASDRLQLASAGVTKGDNGRGELRSSRTAWNQASQGVGSVIGIMRSAVGGLTEGQRGAGGGDAAMEGLLSAVTQGSVYRSWQRKIELLHRECDELKGKLEKSGNAFYYTDSAIKDAFTEQQTRPDEKPDTGRPAPGEGGQSRW